MDDDDRATRIVGDRVTLGPLEPARFPLHVEWVNDPDVAWNVFGRHETRTLDEERAWLERESAKPENRFFLVSRRDEGRPIGVTSLTEIGDPPGTATFRILIGGRRGPRSGVRRRRRRGSSSTTRSARSASTACCSTSSSTTRAPGGCTGGSGSARPRGGATGSIAMGGRGT